MFMFTSALILLLTILSPMSSAGGVDPSLTLPVGSNPRLNLSAIDLSPPHSPSQWNITASSNKNFVVKRVPIFNNKTMTHFSEKPRLDPNRDLHFSLLGMPVQQCCDDVDCDSKSSPAYPGDCNLLIKCGAPCPAEPVDGFTEAIFTGLGSIDTCRKRAVSTKLFSPLDLFFSAPPPPHTPNPTPNCFTPPPFFCSPLDRSARAHATACASVSHSSFSAPFLFFPLLTLTYKIAPSVKFTKTSTNSPNPPFFCNRPFWAHPLGVCIKECDKNSVSFINCTEFFAPLPPAPPLPPSRLLPPPVSLTALAVWCV